jgi:GT2 family glycosyltransferase
MSTSPFALDVVVRCRDEMPFTARTLAALARQRGVACRVCFLDNGSKDGSREAAVVAGAQVVDVEPGGYVPGAVLNRAMRLTRSPVVAFVNADCVPLDDDAVARLVAPLEDERVAATYARQVARPDASRAVRLEYERAFPAGAPIAVRRGAFFSMAASAIRRDAWERLPFDEALRYSEDVDWTHRAGAIGLSVVYTPEARFEHSHDYDLGAQRKRRRGEGTADAAIFRLGAPSIVRDLARPLVGALVRDARAGLFDAEVAATRVAQAVGYYEGRRAAVR